MAEARTAKPFSGETGKREAPLGGKVWHPTDIPQNKRYTCPKHY